MRVGPGPELHVQPKGTTVEIDVPGNAASRKGPMRKAKTVNATPVQGGCRNRKVAEYDQDFPPRYGRRTFVRGCVAARKEEVSNADPGRRRTRRTPPKATEPNQPEARGTRKTLSET